MVWTYSSLIEQCVFQDTGDWKQAEPLTAPCPKIIEHVSDRDLWKFENPDSRALHAFLRLQGFPIQRRPKGDYTKECNEFGTIVRQYEDDEKYRTIVIKSTQPTLRYEGVLIKEICDTTTYLCFFAGWHGIPVCAMPDGLKSEAGQLLMELKGAPFSLTYWDDHVAQVRRYSLCGDGTCDLIEVAQRYGGGGHSTAAGFVTALSDPFVFD